MLRRQRQTLALVLFALDLALTSGAWLAAYVVRFTFWEAPAGIPRFQYVLDTWPWVVAMAAVAYRLCGLYEIHRLRRWSRELEGVCTASGLLFLLIIAFTFYRRELYESRLALGLFLLLNAVLLAAGRRLSWWILERLGERSSQGGRALIVGGGRMARLVGDLLHRNRWAGVEVVGYVDTPGKPGPRGLAWLGPLEQLVPVIAAQRISHVFVALPLERYSELPQISRLLGDVLVDVQFVPDLPDLSGMRLRTLEFEGISCLTLRENPHHGWHRLIKRTMDLVLGSAALVALSPLMLVLALLVKLTSRGPVFFRQTRMGIGGQPFQMFKFRSMSLDAESQTGPVWARKDDERCTPLGRFMRRWSLDELPQLFNVLAGDMSLVGPRPERGVFIERFRSQIPNYTQRHQVKAGITGWAQVNGWRGNTSLRRRIECDLFYICNWSPWLDLKILFLTLVRGFRHPNAY
jgi:Undecaprenyl-phosphate glucose phosphotransferase